MDHSISVTFRIQTILQLGNPGLLNPQSVTTAKGIPDDDDSLTGSPRGSGSGQQEQDEYQSLANIADS